MTSPSTNMSPEWVAKVVRENPFVLLENGNVRTCPCRLSFPNIFRRGKPVEQGKDGKFGFSLIIPPIADLSVPRKVAADAALAKWPNAGQQGGPKLKTPFLAQAEYQQHEGYGPEGFFLRCTADRPFPFVDQRLAPITDERREYPGAWVLATIRVFTYAQAVNKGVAFGAQSLMFLCDDKQLGGGGSNPQQDFAGVNITSDINPAAAFGAGPVETHQPVDVFG